MLINEEDKPSGASYSKQVSSGSVDTVRLISRSRRESIQLWRSFSKAQIDLVTSPTVYV